MSDTTSFGCPILTARKVSSLRQRMIDDMTVRNFAPNTMVAYLKQVQYFSQYFGRSPERLGSEEIRGYQIYLAKERRVSVSSRTVAASALRFLYGVTLKQDRVIDRIPTPKAEHRLPVILSPEEVLRLLQAAPSFPHHVRRGHRQPAHDDSDPTGQRAQGSLCPTLSQVAGIVAHVLAESATAGMAVSGTKPEAASKP